MATKRTAPGRDLSLAGYRSLAEFRYQIRRFLRYSEQAARENGIEPQQHQLLLAIKGLPAGRLATIGELAERMQTKPHSAVELIDRLADRGAVARRTSQEDRREVLIRLTPAGERLLRKLSLAHQIELTRMGPQLMKSLRSVLKLATATERSKDVR